jgi:hypothetical protein
VREWRTFKYAAMSMDCAGGFLKGAQAHNRDIKIMCDYEHMSMAVAAEERIASPVACGSFIVRCELRQFVVTPDEKSFFYERSCLMYNVYYCESVSEQRAARCFVAPGGPDQRRWEAHPGIPPPAPRVEKHETPERD